MRSFVAYYGGSLDAKGIGSCLLKQNHRNGDRNNSMSEKNEHLMCWSQGCFGERGVDVYGLVGVMEGLTNFKDQKRRVLEIAGLSEYSTTGRTLPPPPPQPQRCDWVRTASLLTRRSLDLWLRAEKVLEAARGFDVSEWSEKDFDEALNIVGAAYDDLERSDLLESVAFGLRARKLEEERTRNASGRSAA